MNKILSILSIFLCNTILIFGQNEFAAELIILNGESFGGSSSNIASYDLLSKTYTVFDTIGTNSVQDILIEDNIAYVAAERTIIAYDLNTKTRIAEVDYPGASPNRNAMFIDQDRLYVGNWFGQTDSFLYAFDKSSLSLDFAVAEATTECGGGLALDDVLYIGQRNKGLVDACAPFGCFSDTTGSILVSDANTGNFIRSIDLGVDGSGIEQIYNEDGFLYAVCPSANNIIKIEIANDSIYEVINLAPFTQSLQKIGTRLYLDIDGLAGYYDLADGSTELSVFDLNGTAIAYDQISETAFNTSTDFFSFGSLAINNANTEDTIAVGISPEAIGLYYKISANPIAQNDSFEFIYNEDTETYLLDVLANDTHPNGDELTISSISELSLPDASASIVNNQIEYSRAEGVATTDIFSYTVCNSNNECDTAQVSVTLRSVLSIHNTNESINLNIYPNPADSYISIDCDEEIEYVNIYDITGNLLKTEIVSTINLEDLNKGVYFVTVKTKNFSITKNLSIY